MDILNLLPRKRFRELDDLLAFVSIYDDARRTKAIQKLLRSHRAFIRGAVCVEAGAGLGLFSAELARLGARKVYAVEQNPALARLCKMTFDKLPTTLAHKIELVISPIQNFRSPEHVNVLVQELYGQLLYDEDLWALNSLKFTPDVVLPDGGELRAGILSSARYVDKVVTRSVLHELGGTLVAGLFQERLTELKIPVLRWSFQRGLVEIPHSFANRKGDLACFGVVVTHSGRIVCEAGRCSNWSYVWTARKGNRVSIQFRRNGPTMDCHFKWLS